MTIAMAVLNDKGIVLGSDTRTINEETGEIVKHDSRKNHLITKKIGLVYTGAVRIGNWYKEQEVEALKEIANKGIEELAAVFNERVCKVHSDNGKEPEFSFAIAGYEKDTPKMVTYKMGTYDYSCGYDPDAKGILCGTYLAGTLGVLPDLFKDKHARIDEMSLDELQDFVELTIYAGIKYARYFKGFEDSAGLPIKLTTIMPFGAMTSFPRLDEDLHFISDTVSVCPVCLGHMEAIKDITLNGQHLLYITECPNCKYDAIGILSPRGPKVKKSDKIEQVELNPKAWKITGLTPVEMEALKTVLDVATDATVIEQCTPDFQDAARLVRSIKDTLNAQIINHRAGLLLKELA